MSAGPFCRWTISLDDDDDDDDDNDIDTFPDCTVLDYIGQSHCSLQYRPLAFGIYATYDNKKD